MLRESFQFLSTLRVNSKTKLSLNLFCCYFQILALNCSPALINLYNENV